MPFVGSTAVARGANRAAHLCRNAPFAVFSAVTNAPTNANFVPMMFASSVFKLAAATCANILVAGIVKKE